MGILAKLMKKTVLVVEDDPSLHKALVDKLTREGFDVKETSTGADVVGHVQIYKPDLILLDLMLPVRDGMTILETLRGQDMKVTVPVIILTNLRGDSGLKEQAERLNATYFDKATIEIDEVIEKIKEVL